MYLYIIYGILKWKKKNGIYNVNRERAIYVLII